MSVRPDNQNDLFGEIGDTIGDVERWAKENEIRTIVGVDEVGRGPLAGPVVASAVVLDLKRASQNGWLDRVTDSKLLSEKSRCELFERIRLEARLCSLAQSEAWEIDEINILQASLLAMRRAVEQILPKCLAHNRAEEIIIIVDGNRPIPGISVPQRAVIKGDQRSFNVAAASILAKVCRDRILKRCHLRWPEYGFDAHKGYPTPYHRARIIEHGRCPIHRRSFRVSQPRNNG